MTFQDGPIEGIVITPFRKFQDERGWLMEAFRHDELAPACHPAMGYLSLTLPGVVRGPHEHVDQTDLFIWVGPGTFLLTLWDNRPGSPSYGRRQEVVMGAERPGSVLVPQGVVHCYRCVSEDPGLVLNCPNRLFKGEGKREPVDEIRHEDDPASPFVLDERARRSLAR